MKLQKVWLVTFNNSDGPQLWRADNAAHALLRAEEDCISELCTGLPDDLSADEAREAFHASVEAVHLVGELNG